MKNTTNTIKAQELVIKEIFMKATGIVRRIDDLGRVVIPKEIRRTLRIRDGAPLEIFTNKEGEVIFKKYSPIGEFASFAGQYVETLNRTCGMSVVVTDRDSVIVTAGVSKREYADKKVSEEYESIMDQRALYYLKNDAEKIYACDGATGYVKYAMPIISEGDIIGSVAMISTDEHTITDTESAECKLIQAASSFLGKQFEG
jgi:AbrB family transcriptional regulator (stage V sporulation protein T)